jgi:hypothetical protein
MPFVCMLPDYATAYGEEPTFATTEPVATGWGIEPSASNWIFVESYHENWVFCTNHGESYVCGACRVGLNSIFTVTKWASQ